MPIYRMLPSFCLLSALVFTGALGCPGLCGDLDRYEFEGDVRVVDDTDPDDTDPGPLTCEEGETVCSEQCVDTSEGVQTGDGVEHCGGCDQSCDDPAHGSAICDGGSCEIECDGEREACDGQCIDVLSDPENCGGCETICDEEDVCSGGECLDECPADKTDCDGRCVDIDSHVEHCGGCDNDCDDPSYGSAICEESSCDIECDDAPGIERCGDQCVDTDVGVEIAGGVEHCGECDKLCAASESENAYCEAGDCAYEEIEEVLTPWLTRMHDGEIHIRHWIDEATVDWPSLSGDQVLYMTTDPETDLLSIADYDVETVSGAEPGHTFEDLVPGENIYVALEVDGELEAWTAARPNRLGVDDSVHAIATDPETGVRYVGGSFTQVVTNTGAGVAFPAAPSDAGHVLGFPEVHGSVYTAVADGDGGWYIGGEFHRVGGKQRSHLAQVDASGRVTDWAPTVDSEWLVEVRALAVHDEIVYAGGRFEEAAGASGGSAEDRQNLAAFDTDGELTDWDPGVDKVVHDMVADDGVVYAGGWFEEAGMGSSHGNETARFHLAAFNPAGEVTDWDPGVDHLVEALTIEDGDIYVGGAFQWAGTGSSSVEEERVRLAAFDTDGKLLDWGPEADHTVHTLAADDGLIYLGGRFGQITDPDTSETTTRTSLAAITTGGDLTDWNPGVESQFSPPTVESIAVADGVVYVGGDFLAAGTGTSASEYDSRSLVAAYDLDGNLLDWDPGLVDGFNISVRTLAVDNGMVYAGGRFSAAGTGSTSGSAEERRRLAAFDADQRLLDWDPGVGDASLDAVRALAFDGDVIYAGGDFSEAGMGDTGGGLETRHNLAAIGIDGHITDWDPGADNTVRALVVDGDTIYAGGAFQHVGTGGSGTEVPRSELAAFDRDGQVNDWDPGAEWGVRSLMVHENAIYAGGRFIQAGMGDTGGGEQERLGVASFDPSGELRDWDPGLNTFGISTANALAAAGDIIYAGGEFSNAGNGATGGGEEERTNLAAFGAENGELLDWSPAVDPFGSSEDPVSSLVVDDGMVYVGGTFHDAAPGSEDTDEQRRVGLAAFDTDGELLDWDPGVRNEVQTLDLYGGRLWAGGTFYLAGTGTTGGGAAVRSHLAIFDSDGALIE